MSSTPAHITAGLRPYQIEGVEFLSRNARALLVDDAGLGKTPQALRAADHVGAKAVLVVCPPIALVSWQILQSWQTLDRHVTVVREPMDVVAAGPIGADKLVLVSYHTLSTRPDVVEALCEARWDVLILDEGQYLKNLASARTRAVYGPGKPALVTMADRVWVLSATLAPNHAGEVFPHLAALFADRLGPLANQAAFEAAFCRTQDTPWGSTVRGSKNLAQLRKLMAPVLLRRRKVDVLADLPPLEFIDIPIEVSDRAQQDVDQLLGPACAAILHSVRGTDDAEMEQAEVAMSTARRALGILKAPTVVSHVVDMLEAGIGKILVGALHTDVIDALIAGIRDAGGGQALRIDGRDSLQARVDAVNAFQNEPSCRVLVGQLDACGTAITLTAASDVVFAEAAWTPAVNYQFACRCHRIGTKQGVIARFLYIPNSLDAVVQRVLRRKTQEIARLFD